MKLLKELCLTPSVPGREDRVRKVISRHARDLVDELHTDAMGNLIGLRRPRTASGKASRAAKAPLKVMLAAHMDQIGFLVRHVDDNGYIWLNNVGGFDPRNLFARNVLVCASSGDLPAVLNPAIKPVHIATEQERKTIPEIGEFYVDTGLPAAAVKRKVKIGDMVVLSAPFVEIGDCIVSQCLDNRVGCWAVLKALQKLKRHACEIHAVWTVQEEVGLRGAGPAAFGVEPDIGLSCDTTLSHGGPSVSSEQQVTVLGQGVCLKIMDSSTITDIKLVEALERVARAKKIPCQRGVLPRGGQDGAMVQRSRSGVRTAVFACPIRNIHTAVEMAHTTDLKAYPDLLAAWLAQA
jgi:endoglucanase